jgi:hypothetical protein
MESDRLQYVKPKKKRQGERPGQAKTDRDIFPTKDDKEDRTAGK